jgi:uncharacterized protein
VELLVLIGGAFLVGFAVGASGFADALIASAIWLHVYPPHETVPLIFLIGALVHAASLVWLRVPVELRRLSPFVLGGALGTPIGIWGLQALDPAPLRRAVGMCLVAIAGWQLWGVPRRRPAAGAVPPQAVLCPGERRAADAAVGAVGGILGGVAGISGVVPTLWCALRGWSAQVQRGVYQPYILVMHLWGLGALWAAGGWPAVLLERFVWCLAPLAIGLGLGTAIYRRIDQARFRRLVLVVLLVSGIGLAARGAA